MRDRTVFMNTLGEPNCEDNIPAIFEKHYLKFNYVYDLFEHILDFPEIEKSLKKLNSSQDDDILYINANFKKGTDLDNIVSLIEEFLGERDGHGIEAVVKVVSSNKLNISISANFIEEEMYDDNRFNSTEEVYNG